MIRRPIFSLLICFCLLPQVSQALSFFDILYQQETSNYYAFIEKQVVKLYDNNEDVREKYLKELKVLTGQSKMAGDSFFIYRILTQFILDTAKPKDVKELDDIRDLQENTLEFLIDQVKNDDISTSSREFILTQLGKIANSDFLPKFELNEIAISAIGSLSEDENLILYHTAIVYLKPIALQLDKKWADVSESAAEYIIDDLSSSKTERQRIALLESIDVLKKAEKGTKAIKKIWEGVASAMSDIRSPALQKTVRTQMEALMKANSGQMLKEQVEEVDEALRDMEEKIVIVKEPLQELIENLADESDPVEIDGILTALYKQAQKDRTLLNTIFARLAGMTLLPEISAYKLRMLNEGLIKLAHFSKSSLYFYRTALIFLGEVSVYRSSSHASIPISMLGNLLRSTDYPELVIPVIRELTLSLNSDLPIWIGNRFIGLIFIQTGDSPNEEIALYSAKSLLDIVDQIKRSAFRWEASVRIKHLSLYADNEAVTTLLKKGN